MPKSSPYFIDANAYLLKLIYETNDGMKNKLKPVNIILVDYIQNKKNTLQCEEFFDLFLST